MVTVNNTPQPARNRTQYVGGARSLFMLAAVVFLAFAVYATAVVAQTTFGISWTTWLCSGILAYFARYFVDVSL